VGPPSGSQSPRTYRPDVIALKVRTRQSRSEVALAARTRIYVDRHEIAADRATHQTEDCIQQVPSFDVEEGLPVQPAARTGPARHSPDPRLTLTRSGP
jgi:hypothetical protein